MMTKSDRARFDRLLVALSHTTEMAKCWHAHQAPLHRRAKDPCLACKNNARNIRTAEALLKKEKGA